MIFMEWLIYFLYDSTIKNRISWSMVLCHEQRDVAIYLLRRHTNKTLAEIGKHYEITNYSTVSTVVEKIKSQIKTDLRLSKQTKQLEQKLSKSQQQT